MLHAMSADRPEVDALPPTEPITLPFVDGVASVGDAGMPVRVVWARVASGLHVANSAATFVGTVTEVPSGFETMDGAGRPRGTFATLDAAKTALEACARAARAAQPAAPAAQLATVA
jgi:hypothetical protein